MAYLALEQAMPASRTDEVFQAHRQRQYPRQLLFSSMVELMLLVTLGLRPRCTRPCCVHWCKAVPTPNWKCQLTPWPWTSRPTMAACCHPRTGRGRAKTPSRCWPDD